MNDENAFNEARKLESQGKYALAAEEYKRAIDLGIGDLAIAHQGRGKALAQLGRYEEAWSDCQEALALDPELHLAHGVLGYIYTQQAKYDLAEEEYLTAWHLQPTYMIALISLAGIYSKQGDYEKAIDICKKGLQHQPQNLELRIALAELYRSQSHFREAIKQLNEARKAELSFRILFLAAAVLVNVVLQFFTRLNPLIRTGISVAIYGIALLAPPFLSIPVGLLLLGFGLLLVFMYPRIYTYKGKEFKVLSLFLLYFLNCAIYWGIVFLLRPRLVE